MNFDSWFASSKEYEKLKKKKFLFCLNTNSSKNEKNLKNFKKKDNKKKIKNKLNF